ncbi:MAG: HAD-IA family hydrolase, partial [Parachlamydiaceae bacterium]|nr:HAD-IA family hydrolase [Parachlamydiaceae bacterium]
MVNQITTLFCDIGGVLLTNGWDRNIRKNAAEQFDMDFEEFENRHQLCFYLFEIGKISLKEYLEETVFYKERSFTMEKFIDFMHAQSKPYDEMIAFVKELKDKYHLKVVILSNEGRELTDYRQKKFALTDFADFFVVSSYVHLRKPDKDIFQLALDLVQTPPESIIYIDDRGWFI